MSEVETLGILDEIEALVSDKLQVVSYKWLSRNFLVSSNTAKILLQEFVEKHQDGLEVVYSLSGWLKENPLNYHIRLVPGPKLAEAKQEFNGFCSIQVYSVQTCIPKDPATLWNAEFVQTEELFSQPATVENCLRDNRFCGISSSFVKRGADGKTCNNAVAASSNSTHQKVSTAPTELIKVEQTSQKNVHQPLNNGVRDVHVETKASACQNQVTNPPADKGKIASLPSDKKIGQNNKSSSAAGGSLANMWGRASTKSKEFKPVSGPAETNNTIPDSTGGADAQISAHEAAEMNSDDEGMNFKRTSKGEAGKKRRVVFDFSDEENEFEDAVSLASPELSKAHSRIDSKANTETAAVENKKCDEPVKVQVKVEKEKPADKESRQPFQEDISSLKGGLKTSTSSSDEKHGSELKASGKVTKAAPTSPKRRKVLKTRIDERGREVTEVVWEGEETKTKADITNVKKTKAGSTNVKKSGEEPVPDTVNRPVAAMKSPVVAPAAPKNAAAGGKAGNKKGGGAKDPKQGNIMSFFKKA